MTERDARVLLMLRPYKYLPTEKIWHAIFPNDKDGAVARGRLRKIASQGYVRRQVHRIRRDTIEVFVVAWAITELGKKWLMENQSSIPQPAEQSSGEEVSE